MSSQPLSGHAARVGATSPAEELIRYLLADLGAAVRVARDEGASVAVDGGRVALSAYGERGRFAGGPAHHSAVEAVTGALMGQYTYTPGPAYLVTPYSTVGHALLATSAALAGALGRAPAHVSAAQGLFAIQTGAYAFGPTPDAHRWTHSPRGQTPTYASYRAADDYLFIGASTLPFMLKVLDAVGLDDILSDPRVAQGPRALVGTDLQAQMWERIGEAVRRQPRDAWLAEFERRGVPAGPMLSIEESLSHPQITAAGLAEPGEPIGRLTRLVAVSRRGEGRPRLGESPGPLPLSGTRVVELAGYIAGPYVGRLLADMGAEVVKIEPPDGDPFRTLGYGFIAWNHGKRSLALNLRDTGERARLLALVREADILVTNYRPEALARMGLGRDDLFAVNPALLHCTVSAFGEAGPLAHLPGFDPVVQGFAGIFKRLGGDGEPVKSQIAATDYLAGMLGAIGLLAARIAQLEHGGGAVVQTSLLAAALLLNFFAYEEIRAGRPYTRGGRDFKGPHPLNGLHEAGDGWLLTVRPDARPGEAAAAERYLADGARHDTRDDALARLRALGVPAVPCLHPEQLVAEPHFTDDGMWLTVEQPELGAITLPAPVLGSVREAGPAPTVGQHNAEPEAWGAGPGAE